MFISWIYATLKFYLLDFRKPFQTITASTSPADGTRPVFLKPILPKLRSYNPPGANPFRAHKEWIMFQDPPVSKARQSGPVYRLVAIGCLPF